MVEPLSENAEAQLRSKIIGHHENLHLLERAVKSKRLASALAFAGPSGIGRQKIAFSLAQNILCEKPHLQSPISLNMACGSCGPCRRTLAAYASNENQRITEGLFFLEPEKNIINVEQVRQLQDFLSLALLGRARVLIINDAHKMNAAAANSFLKILEEPPPETHFILLIPNPRALLPTVRSRLQILRFLPLTVKELKLSTLARESQAWMLNSAQGSFSRLLELQDWENNEARESSLKFLNLLYSNEPWLLVREDWKLLWKDKKSAQEILLNSQSLIRDALFVAEAGSEASRKLLLNEDQMSLVESLASLGAKFLITCFSLVFEAEIAIRAQRDPLLVLESLYLKSKENRVATF